MPMPPFQPKAWVPVPAPTLPSWTGPDDADQITSNTKSGQTAEGSNIMTNHHFSPGAALRSSPWLPADTTSMNQSSAAASQQYERPPNKVYKLNKLINLPRSSNLTSPLPTQSRPTSSGEGARHEHSARFTGPNSFLRLRA